MDENVVARAVLDAAFHVHRELGPGLLESAYEAVLAYELSKRGWKVQVQVPIPLIWDDLMVKECFRADLIVEDRVLVELKSVERTIPIHKKQVITYLRLADIRLGILINFGTVVLRDGIERIVNRL